MKKPSLDQPREQDHKHQKCELLRRRQPVHWQEAPVEPLVSGSRRPASETPGVPDSRILRLPLSKNSTSQGAVLASLSSSSEAPIFSGSDFEGSRPSRALYPRHLGASGLTQLVGIQSLYGSDKAPRTQPSAVATPRGPHGLPPFGVPERFKNEKGNTRRVSVSSPNHNRQHGRVAKNLDFRVS